MYSSYRRTNCRKGGKKQGMEEEGTEEDPLCPWKTAAVVTHLEETVPGASWVLRYNH